MEDGTSGSSPEYPETLKASTVNSHVRYQRASSSALDGTASETDVPLYLLSPGGSPWRPTGLVLVRFTDGTSAVGRASDLEREGFRIDRLLPYAPHAAMVAPLTGRMSDALNNLDRLEALEGMVNVEPQLIGVRSTKPA